MEKLKILPYLTDIKEYNGVAMKAKLLCSCGKTSFSVYHTGKQTKGILRPYIVKQNNQLVVIAKCLHCGKEIEIYNFCKSGTMSTENQSDLDVAKLIIPQKQKSDFDIVLAFNYYPENLKCGNDYSNKFEDCFIYALDEYGKEKYIIVE